jgi:hypothetical protein
MIIINSIGAHDPRFNEILMRFDDKCIPSIDVGHGWAELVLECHKRLVDFDGNYKVLQIKEKFGGLRYYFMPSNPAFTRTMHLRIIDLEKRSYLTCEVCGNPGNLRTRRPNGWMKTLCLNHAPESEGYISASTLYIQEKEE